MTPQESLLYWIRERYWIYLSKEAGKPKPWSNDPVFQRTYFCNVHRENDKVTQWIRNYYSPHVGDDLFEYNIVLSRFLNWPDTLRRVGYLREHNPVSLRNDLMRMAEYGKIWGNAYVITTHGIKMPKAQYLCENVLGAVYERLEHLRRQCRGAYCGYACAALEEIEGIGSFLGAQIVADLKNTLGHPLSLAHDKKEFVRPGPGSLRGVKWYFSDSPSANYPINFQRDFAVIRKEVDEHWPEGVPPVDNQDLQNCLCEFDKYMRVKTGSGRSKRGYNGV